MVQFLAVKNFERFQHYKDRAPLWIKLYRALLDDLEFLSLPEAAQAQLVKIWLFASTCENRIPHDAHLIGQAIHLPKRGRLYVPEFIRGGWLEILEQSASNGASKRIALTRGDARSREEEGEKEVETEKPSSSPRVKRSGRDLLLEHLQPSQREAMSQTLDTLAQGYDIGAGYGVPTAAQMDQACTEVAASVPAHEIGAKVVRGFLRSVMKPTERPPSRSGGKPTSFAEMAAARKHA